MSERTSTSRRQTRWYVHIALLAVLGMLLSSSVVVSAQEGTPATESIVAGEVAPTPTPVPPQPTPTPVPDVPVEVPEQPVEPTFGPEQPAVEPTAGAEAAADQPTEAETPTATSVPAGQLTYTVAAQPSCVLAPDQPSAVASGGSIDYLCSDTVSMSGTGIVPAAIDVIWTPWTSIEGGWTVQMLPPTNPGDAEPAWTAEGQVEAWFDFRQRNPLGASTEPATIDQTVEVIYRVRVHRPACTTTALALYLDRAIAVESSDHTTVITAAPVVTEPVLVTPELEPIPEPSVAFGGLLSFGEVALTADGVETAVRTGTLSATIADLDQTCGEWTLNVTADSLTNADGAPLDGSQLVVVSVNDEPLPDGGCDLSGGCNVASLAGGPDAPSSQSIALGVELRMPEQPQPGTFKTPITAALHSAVAD